MRAPPITEPAAHLVVRRTLKLRVKRTFATSPTRRTSVRACYIKLPRKLWDNAILLMFTCCLIAFLHALSGSGIADEDSPTKHDTFVRPRALPWRGDAGKSNGDGEMRGVTRVIVDWHGDYELLPSTTSISPASIPQDAFPDPTPSLVEAGRGRAPGEGSPSVVTKVKTPATIPFTLYGTLYDPFRLEFEDSVDRGGLYPIAEPPRTTSRTRTRRFGRCPPRETSGCR